jgi:hypothetical protein
VLLFCLSVTLGGTLVFGLLPAVRFSRPELISSIKDDSGGGGRRVGRIHRVAASAQTGMAFVFLAVSVIFVRAAGVLEDRELGSRGWTSPWQDTPPWRTGRPSWTG